MDFSIVRNKSLCGTDNDLEGRRAGIMVKMRSSVTAAEAKKAE